MAKPTTLVTGARGILFDLFGTVLLVDETRLPELRIGDRTVRSALAPVCQALVELTPELTLEQILSAVAATRAERGARAPDDWREVPDRDLFARMLYRLPQVRRTERLAVALADLQMGAVAAAAREIGSAPALLACLRRSGVRTALVSNLSHARAAPALLRSARLEDAFDALVFSEDVGFCKPHAAMFECAIQSLGIEAGSAVHVGDEAIADVWGAGQAGVRAVWVNPTGAPFPRPEHGPARIVASLEELLAELV